MQSKVFETLVSLGVTSYETREVFHNRSRDVESLTVWRDLVSGVVYISDRVTDESEYRKGEYRAEVHKASSVDYESMRDTIRRLDSIKQALVGKRVMDFGCGSGAFLTAARELAADVVGVELQDDFREILNKKSIRCVDQLSGIEDFSVDVCVSFHVLEHLEDPIETLRTINKKLVKGGTLIVEVPHAKDFLLDKLKCLEFKEFTLWSQHLILHTRDSLCRLLSQAGFGDIFIKGVQRYPLSNHLQWLTTGRPGGHRSNLSSIEVGGLFDAYEASLSSIDATDTLFAFAKSGE